MSKSLFLVGTLLLLFIWPWGLCSAKEVKLEQPLTLGVFAYRPKSVMAQQWQPLVDYFNESFANDSLIELRLLTQPEMHTALQQGELDFLLTNPVHYIQLSLQFDLSGPLATLMVYQSGIAIAQLGGVIIKRSEHPMPVTFNELARQRIAIVGKQFLGGYIAQAMELKQHGLDLDKLDYLHVGDYHDRVVEAVLEQRAEIGFIRTGVLEQMLEEGKLYPGQLAVVAPLHHDDFPFVSSTRLYPEWAFVALPHVPPDISRQIAARLYMLDANHAAAQAAGIYGFSIPTDYRVIEEALRSLRLPPFEEQFEFSWSDVRERYRFEIILGMVLLCMIAVLTVILGLNNRRLRHLRRQAKQTSVRLQRILEGTGAATWEWDVPHNHIRLNTRWTEITGYGWHGRTPVSTETWFALLHPDDLQANKTALEEHFSGKTDVYATQFRLRHCAGHWIWIEVRGRILTQTAKGEPQWMFGTAVDITARRQIEQERDIWLKRLQEFAENVPGMLYQFRLRPDGSSHVPFANARIVDIYGCDAETVIDDASPIFAVLHPDDRAAVQTSVNVSAQALTTWHASYRILHPNRGERWVEGHATPSREEDGSVTWHGYIDDITERYQARQQILLIASVFKASHEGIYITDTAHRIIDVNPAFVDITGYTFDAIKHQTPHQLYPENLVESLANDVLEGLQKDEFWQGESRLLRISGEIIPIELTVSTVHDDEGEISHYITVFNDISLRKAYEEKLKYIAYIDPLTGIANRRHLMHQLTQVVAQAKRFNRIFALCMLDLDNFKPINDQFGHEAGDQVLVEIAKRLGECIRTGDTVGRLGGDEFVLILHAPQGEKVFERILQAVCKPIFLTGKTETVEVSTSMGIVYWDPKHPREGEHLLRLADEAAYQSKANGRNQFTLYSDPA